MAARDVPQANELGGRRPGQRRLRGSAGTGGRCGLDLDQRLACPLFLVGTSTTAYAEQPLGDDEVDDQREVDHERADLQVRDLVGELVDLQRQEQAGAD